MLKLILFGLSLALPSFAAELDLRHPDQILLESWVGGDSARAVEVTSIPAKVRATIEEQDLGFEMGDGYYDLKASAVYEVVDPKNKFVVVGYIYAGILSYTEGDDYYLAEVYVNTWGRRLNPEIDAASYSDSDLDSLPIELRPPWDL